MDRLVRPRPRGPGQDLLRVGPDARGHRRHARRFRLPQRRHLALGGQRIPVDGGHPRSAGEPGGGPDEAGCHARAAGDGTDRTRQGASGPFRRRAHLRAIHRAAPSAGRAVARSARRSDGDHVVMGPARGGVGGAADRVRQRGQPVPRPRFGPLSRPRGEARHRGLAGAARPPADDRSVSDRLDCGHARRDPHCRHAAALPARSSGGHPPAPPCRDRPVDAGRRIRTRHRGGTGLRRGTRPARIGAGPRPSQGWIARQHRRSQPRTRSSRRRTDRTRTRAADRLGAPRAELPATAERRSGLRNGGDLYVPVRAATGTPHRRSGVGTLPPRFHGPLARHARRDRRRCGEQHSARRGHADWPLPHRLDEPRRRWCTAGPELRGRGLLPHHGNRRAARAQLHNR